MDDLGPSQELTNNEIPCRTAFRLANKRGSRALALVHSIADLVRWHRRHWTLETRDRFKHYHDGSEVRVARLAKLMDFRRNQ